MQRHHLIAVALLVATLVAYEPLRRNAFILYDDSIYITENPHVASGLSAQGAVWAFNAGHTGNWHPLTWFSHMLDVALWGLERPWAHHLTSLLLHAASTLVLFHFLRRATHETWKSAFVAAVFALHPQHVESVAWASERKDVLSTLLGFLSIACWLSWTRRGGAGRYWGAWGLYAASLSAKPMLVTLPFLLLLLDLWPLARLRLTGAPPGSVDARRGFPALLREKAPFFVLAAASCAITVVAQSRGGAIVGNQVLSLSFRLGHAASSYVAYLAQAVWPSHLSVFYPYPPGPMSITRVALCALCLAAASVIAIRAAARRPWLTVGWLWWLGMLVPVIGILQVGGQARADRYTYVSMVGLSIVVAWGASEIAARWWGARGRTVAAASGLAVVALFTGMTRAHAAFWEDEERLFRHAAQVTPGNYMAHSRIAYALTEKGRYAEAEEEYRLALAADPRFAEAANDFGRLLEKQGRLDEAIARYREAVSIDPDFAMWRENLASALAGAGAFDEASVHFGEALRLAPERAEVHNSFGVALLRRAQLEIHRGEEEEANRFFAEALLHFEEAKRLKPSLGDAWLNHGVTLANLGRLPEAIVSLSEGLRLRPDRAEARSMLERIERDFTESAPIPR